MRSPFTFVPRKKLAGAYFNDGSSTYHVQQMPDKPPDPMLVEAIRASAREFSRIFNQRADTATAPASAPTTQPDGESAGGKP